MWPQAAAPDVQTLGLNPRYPWSARFSAWRVPWPDPPKAFGRDPCDEPRRGIGHGGEHDAGPDVGVREPLEDLGGIALGHPRLPVHDELLEQAPLVPRGRRYRQRTRGIAAEVPQLPLVRHRRQDDLVPLDPDQAAVTCGPPSWSIVTTCATASLPRSARAASGRRIPAICGCLRARAHGVKRNGGYWSVTRTNA